MSVSTEELARPGVGGGLAEVFRTRFLLKLLVRKELKVRYRGSVLGLLWSYVKPGVQFIVFYIALGVFLGLENSPRNPGGLPNYAIYLFSGIVLINFFNEALGNASRSIVNNGGSSRRSIFRGSCSRWPRYGSLRCISFRSSSSSSVHAFTRDGTRHSCSWPRPWAGSR